MIDRLRARAHGDAAELDVLSWMGRTTLEIDTAVHEFVVAHGAYPSPLRYKGFPRACCTSVNNVVVHGIPDELSIPPVLLSFPS